jgi:hypothetical protein
VSNVLSDDKRHQVIALGRLGWPLRRIEKETGVRRETAGAYREGPTGGDKICPIVDSVFKVVHW